MASQTYTVPPLPYPYNVSHPTFHKIHPFHRIPKANISPPLPKALEPCISEQIMHLHHDKHHTTYVNNLNAALRTQFDSSSTTQQSDADRAELQAKIAFNAGGHINHTLFWENLTPRTSPQTKESAAPKLSAALTAKWGNMVDFKQKFKAVLLGIRGSGWGWLVASLEEEGARLDIVTTKDQETVPEGWKPLLGVDMWEHAYYLQYLNDKAGYVDKIWEVVNWEVVEGRFVRETGDGFGGLGGLKHSL